MRVQVRKSVDIDRYVDISKLSSVQKIVVAIQKSYRETKLYKRKMERTLEREYREKAAREEALKTELLSRIYDELIKNRRLSQNGLVCSAIVLSVRRDCEKELKEVLTHKDFISYHIKVLTCNPDMLKSFNKIPIFVEVRRKFIGGEDIENT